MMCLGKCIEKCAEHWKRLNSWSIVEYGSLRRSTTHSLLPRSRSSLDSYGLRSRLFSNQMIHIGRPLRPRFAGATPIVVVIRRPIPQVDGSLIVVGAEGFAPLSCANAFPDGFQIGDTEIRLTEAVLPGQLKFFEVEDMLKRVELASLNASKKLEAIKKTAAAR